MFVYLKYRFIGVFSWQANDLSSIYIHIIFCWHEFLNIGPYYIVPYAIVLSHIRLPHRLVLDC
ncbi:hypothetical protein HanIR_Chr04g0179941 [Helianthus annuus]|nr:hypothetical protein HanIR_Chr04g0179941 [Helianthus annuus]